MSEKARIVIEQDKDGMWAIRKGVLVLVLGIDGKTRWKRMERLTIDDMVRWQTPAEAWETLRDAGEVVGHERS